MDGDREKEIEEKIAELERRWPRHSVPPQLWVELEELERQLEEVRQAGSGDPDGR